jgi:hypothetical protein
MLYLFPFPNIEKEIIDLIVGFPVFTWELPVLEKDVGSLNVMLPQTLYYLYAQLYIHQ